MQWFRREILLPQASPVVAINAALWALYIGWAMQPETGVVKVCRRGLGWLDVGRLRRRIDGATKRASVSIATWCATLLRRHALTAALLIILIVVQHVAVADGASLHVAPASIAIRYFAPTGAGAADGTTWADRAALLSAGSYTTPLTGYAFNTDAMEARVQGGQTYTPTQALASGLFGNAPAIATPLIVVGCDSSGNVLAIPDPNWLSPMPAWSTSTLPVLNTTTNIGTLNLTTVSCTLVAFTASGRNGAVIQASLDISWCSVINSTANTAAVAISAVSALANCICQCTGSSYDSIISNGNQSFAQNIRLEGVAGSSGNRRGWTQSGNSAFANRLTIVNCGGEAAIYTGTGTGQFLRFYRFTLANNGATAFKANSTASQTTIYVAEGGMITGNTGWGIDGNSNGARWLVIQTRLRDNSSGDITGIGNYPTDLPGMLTTDSDDATEYVSTGANGDFRIKNTAAIWGKGYGAGDEPPAINSIIGGSIVRAA